MTDSNIPAVASTLSNPRLAPPDSTTSSAQPFEQVDTELDNDTMYGLKSKEFNDIVADCLTRSASFEETKGLMSLMSEVMSMLKPVNPYDYEDGREEGWKDGHQAGYDQAMTAWNTWQRSLAPVNPSMMTQQTTAPSYAQNAAPGSAAPPLSTASAPMTHPEIGTRAKRGKSHGHGVGTTPPTASAASRPEYSQPSQAFVGAGMSQDQTNTTAPRYPTSMQMPVWAHLQRGQDHLWQAPSVSDHTHHAPAATAAH